MLFGLMESQQAKCLKHLPQHHLLTSVFSALTGPLPPPVAIVLTVLYLQDPPGQTMFHILLQLGEILQFKDFLIPLV